MQNNRSFIEQYGPWALITGASSGIGAAFARALACEGFNIVLVARRKQRLDEMARELMAEFAVQVDSLELDLSATDFIEQLMQATRDKDIGLVISNAGFGFKGPHHEQDPTKLNQLIDINARAPTLITNQFAPQLIKRGKGGIILTGSVEGMMGFPLSGAYAASKAYVLALGEALWEELRPQGVDVMVLAPGATDTENLRLQGFDARKMPNVMSADEVARLALANIKKGPCYITGFSNRLMMFFLRCLPRRMALGMAAKGTLATMKKAAF